MVAHDDRSAKRCALLVYLPRSLIDRLRADAERAGLSLSRELEEIVRQRDADAARTEAS